MRGRRTLLESNPLENIRRGRVGRGRNQIVGPSSARTGPNAVRPYVGARHGVPGQGFKMFARITSISELVLQRRHHPGSSAALSLGINRSMNDRNGCCDVENREGSWTAPPPHRNTLNVCFSGKNFAPGFVLCEWEYWRDGIGSKAALRHPPPVSGHPSGPLAVPPTLRCIVIGGCDGDGEEHRASEDVRPLQGQWCGGDAHRGRRAQQTCPCPRLFNFNPCGVIGGSRDAPTPCCGSAALRHPVEIPEIGSSEKS